MLSAYLEPAKARRERIMLSAYLEPAKARPDRTLTAGSRSARNRCASLSKLSLI
jgi:hypothetical protein